VSVCVKLFVGKFKRTLPPTAITSGRDDAARAAAAGHSHTDGQSQSMVSSYQ